MIGVRFPGAARWDPRGSGRPTPRQVQLVWVRTRPTGRGPAGQRGGRPPPVPVGAYFLGAGVTAAHPVLARDQVGVRILRPQHRARRQAAVGPGTPVPANPHSPSRPLTGASSDGRGRRRDAAVGETGPRETPKPASVSQPVEEAAPNAAQCSVRIRPGAQHHADVAQQEERALGKSEATGSTPVIGSVELKGWAGARGALPARRDPSPALTSGKSAGCKAGVRLKPPTRYSNHLRTWRSW